MGPKPDAPFGAFPGKDMHAETSIRRLERERDAGLEEASHMREQLELLAEATKSLTELVTNTLTLDNPEMAAANGDLSNTTTVDGVPKEERPLDDLLQDAKLKVTGFSDLGNGCKRLCEKLRLTAMEADDLLYGMQAANQANEAAKEKFRITSKALTKLYKENEALRKENLKLKKDRKRVARQVSAYVDELKSETDRKLDEAYALMAHEKALPPANRMKLDSFSDDESTAALSFPSPSTATCMSASASTVTSTSLVTDGGNATLRIRACTDDDISALTTKNMPSAAAIVEENNAANSSSDTFTVDSEVCDEDQEPASVGNFIGMLMSREGVDRNVYDINFSSNRIGLRMRAIPNRQKDGKRAERRKKDTNSLDLSGSSAKPSNEVFLVCGFRDYDLSLDKRPELGARLVAVDSTSIEYGQWTLKKVCDKIRSREEGVCLSFRNDKLSKGDIARLDKFLAPNKAVGDEELTEEEQARPKLPFRKIWIPEVKRKHEASLDSQYYI